MYPDTLTADGFSLLPRRICSAVHSCLTEENLLRGTWATKLCPLESGTEALVYLSEFEMRMVGCRVNEMFAVSQLAMCAFPDAALWAQLYCPAFSTSRPRASRHVDISGRLMKGIKALVHVGEAFFLPSPVWPQNCLYTLKKLKCLPEVGPRPQVCVRMLRCPKLPAKSGCMSLTLTFAFWLFPPNEPVLTAEGK